MREVKIERALLVLGTNDMLNAYLPMHQYPLNVISMYERRYRTNEKLLGIIINKKYVLCNFFELTDGKNYFLHKFYIEVNDQAKGIGSKLFAHVLEQMPNAETIELYVNRENYKTVNFYFKHGFVIKKTIDQDIGEGFYMNDFVMIKKIK